jgi:ABC-type transporter Mla subunit MlaD
VVASEVKNLSSQTAKATEEISAHIGPMHRATGDTVAAIQGISGSIGQIGDIAKTIATAVEQQGLATKEIAHSVSKAAAVTSQVAGNINAVTRTIDATGSATKQMPGAASCRSRQIRCVKSSRASSAQCAPPDPKGLRTCLRFATLIGWQHFAACLVAGNRAGKITRRHHRIPPRPRRITGP